MRKKLDIKSLKIWLPLPSAVATLP